MAHEPADGGPVQMQLGDEGVSAEVGADGDDEVVVCSTQVRRAEHARAARVVPYSVLGSQQGQPHELPEHTDVWCKHDCHPFDNPPVPVPVERRSDGNYTYDAVCCSPACALAHIEDCYHGCERASRKITFRRMMVDTYGLAPGDVVTRAPPSCRLRVLNAEGDLNVKEFRAAATAAEVCAPEAPAFVDVPKLVRMQQRRPHEESREGYVVTWNMHGLRRPTDIPRELPRPEAAPGCFFERFAAAQDVAPATEPAATARRATPAPRRRARNRARTTTPAPARDAAAAGAPKTKPRRSIFDLMRQQAP